MFMFQCQSLLDIMGIMTKKTKCDALRQLREEVSVDNKCPTATQESTICFQFPTIDHHQFQLNYQSFAEKY